MNIAVIHYHLNRGGVTQVIANHLRAMAATAGGEPTRVAILFGGRRDGWSEDLAGQLPAVELSLCTVPELEYDASGVAAPDRLANGVAAALAGQGLAASDTILHVHNHSLGKSVSLGSALGQLADQGFPLLLQIHDFAEDFRPENYRRLRSALASGGPGQFAAQVYPQADQIHYAVLTHRDRETLQDAGVDARRLHLLPNVVPDPEPLPPRETARALLKARCGLAADARFVLYPTRGIRRKNVGESLLWAALGEPDTTVGLTLAPLSPPERAAYDRWKQLAAELSLPCLFELGETAGVGYANALASADAMLTTSVAEGFGLVFLEAWLRGVPLVGRDLPEVTADLKASGLELGSLHRRFDVPLPWIGRDRLERDLAALYGRVLADFDRRPPADEDFRRELDELVGGGAVDFALLGAAQQQQVLRHVQHDPGRRNELRSLNEWFTAALALDARSAAETIRRNAAVTRREYSLQRCGERLRRIYGQVVASRRGGPRSPLPHPERILDAFLSLARFHPVRFAP